MEPPVIAVSEVSSAGINVSLRSLGVVAYAPQMNSAAERKVNGPICLL